MLKPQPTNAAETGSQRARPSSIARRHAHAARTSSRTRRVSGLLSRLIATVMGVSARTAAAMSAAGCPNARRTVACRTAMDATPNRACGSSRLQAPNPRTRANRPIAHSAMGGLSTVMNDPASREPKKNAFQLWVPLFTAAE